MILKSNQPINQYTIKNLSEILLEYDILSNTNTFSEQSKKIYLQQGKEYTCRFCGKSKPIVKFKLEAHAIPDFMGNKNLFSKFECDDCNKYFSKFENELANFMLQYNTMAGTISKGSNPPKYKMKDGLEISNDNTTIHIKKLPDEIFKDKTEFEFKVKVPSYIPESIYRCLIKIGLCIIPEEKLDIFSSAIEWLMNENTPILQPCMIFSIFPFTYDTKKINCTIFIKKEDVTRNIPTAIMVLSYKNFCFQTFFPLSKDIKYNEPFYPFPYNFPFPSQLDFIEGIEDEKEYGVKFLDSKERTNEEYTHIRVTSIDGVIIREEKAI